MFIVVYHFLRHLASPCRRMQFFRKSIGSCSMIIPTYMSGIRIQSGCLHLEPQTIITDKVVGLHPTAFINQRTMETMQSFLREPMHLANTECIIIQVTQHLRHLITISTSYPTISQHAMMPRRQSSQQTRTGWRTTRCRRIAIQKKSSVIGQSVQVRSDYRKIAHAMHRISPMLIGYNEDNMWLLLCRQVSRYQASTSGYRTGCAKPFILLHRLNILK